MSATNYQQGDRLNFPSGYDYTASGTVVANQYYVVKFGSSSTAGQIVQATSSSDIILGVLANLPTSTNSPYAGPFGTIAEVHARNAQGTFKVQAGGSFSVGAYLTATTGGLAVLASQTTAGQQPAVQVFGLALEASTASGQIVLYMPCNFLY